MLDWVKFALKIGPRGMPGLGEDDSVQASLGRSKAALDQAQCYDGK
jgi:hypothetical protein